MFACEAVDLHFLDTAPNKFGAAVTVARPPGEVFAALAHDPANWGAFGDDVATLDGVRARSEDARRRDRHDHVLRAP